MTMDNQSLLLRSALRHTREEDAITVAERTGKARILVVGTGGGGNNTVNRIMTVGINGAECIAMNTDKKHLDAVKANQKILLGPNQTRGLGAGGFPEIGETAAEESIDEIRSALEGADLIFIAVGLGGGTGTGSAPVIARIAREEIGAIVVGTATMPFTVERARVEKA
ncbi:MAG: cell division protein FtsZ, partial [Candidatus Ranarchaeia archaeon]